MHCKNIDPNNQNQMEGAKNKKFKKKKFIKHNFFLKVTNKNEWMQKYMEENISLTTME